MSAIAGIYQFNNQSVSVEDINAMMGALKHFPANDIRVWNHQPNMFLGCHAQWITPESIGEVVPYYDYERRLAITADAIIDNREELFQMLQIPRDEQKSMPDSELLLLAYRKWGEETPKHLIGDFAFMIWDEKEQKLFGARDFSGSRTLYYYKDHQRFAFCTTIKPLLELSYVEKRLNEEWLAEFIAVTHMFDTYDCHSTVFGKIMQVPPSHSFLIKEGKMKLIPYSASAIQETRFKKNEDYVEAFQEIFSKAVNSRLRTFHHVGAQLSGGLDSGSVASFAAKSLKQADKRLLTFSYIPGQDFSDWTPSYRVANERPYIQSTVLHSKNMNNTALEFKGKSSYTEIDDWLDIMEMPYKFFENSFWVKGIQEEASQKGIGILLNGARGNLSISWGPALDYYSTLLKGFKWLRLYKEINLYSKNIGFPNKKRILKVVSQKAFPKFGSTDSYEFPSIINSEFAKKTGVFTKVHNIENEMKKLNYVENRQDHFQNQYTWNTTGNSNTKLSLRYGIWNRDPTNDRRVIDYCLSVPVNQYVQHGVDRALIRRATENYLPDNVRLNQLTRGIQGADWLHRIVPEWKAVKDELKEMTNNKEMIRYFNMDYIRSELKNFHPRPEKAFDSSIRVLMRTLIVYRFISKFH
ncbi:asparagine synthase-related protein [Falsibacillus albus]|uniref:asparagine synthase (glutamine-hydrolyzing) n=1 Tax=Falsibacillus albus TaxID=2478915 RepID=A0A3L7JZT2_9BACI|nr:asparagine synthase-related protein [Falsibacillus albus]RLQ96293.1 asparagine synthetase B [Falsibacillus albus]